MQEFVVFDVRRCRNAEEMLVASADDAKREFASWYQTLVKPDRWEGRKLGRYFLLSMETDAEGRLLPVSRRFVACDEDVRLSYEYVRMTNPPHDDVSERELDEWFDRVDGADAARLAARGNRLMEFFDGDDDTSGDESGPRPGSSPQVE